MYVCTSVRYGFTIEIYGFTHTLPIFLARAAHDAIAHAMEVEDLEDRSQHQNLSRDIEVG